MLTSPSAPAVPTQSRPVVAVPLTDHCAQVATRAVDVTLGISPFNGYYTQDRVDVLVAWALSTFDSAHFYVPDMSPQHTFVALGYAEGKARTKARNQGKYVLNKVRTAVARYNDAHGRSVDADSLLLCSATLADNAGYQRLAAQGRERFATDPAFRTATLQTSRWILEGKLEPGTTPTDAQAERAVEYFLDELPLFLDTPAITGVGPSLFVYHQPVEYLRSLYDHELTLQPSADQGFLVAHADVPEPRPAPAEGALA